MSVKKVIIVDDHQMLADMLKQYCNTFDGFECVGIVNNGSELINELKSNTTIDIVILDFSMPIVDGINALRIINELDLKVKVLIVSSTTNPIRIQKALNLGAMGFVNKSEKVSVIYEALKSLDQDKVFVSKMGDEAISKLVNSETGVEYLTSREQDILELMIAGMDYNAIGEQLFLSPRTIQKHKDNIFSKLEVKSKTELYKKIKDLGWE